MARPRKNTATDATPTADDTKLATLADVNAAIDGAVKRLAHAENTLALRPNDIEANATRRDALAKLTTLSAERESLQRIEAHRTAARKTEEEKAKIAAARETAKRIPQSVLEQGEAFAKIINHLEAVADLVEAIENSQRDNDYLIRALPGDERARGMLARAARVVAINRPLRSLLVRLRNTRLLSGWLEVVNVPAEPDRNPFRGETHAEAAARIAALPTTAAEVYAETAANVERLVCGLLGPAPEATPGVSWYGSTKPNGGDTTSAEANMTVAVDNSTHKARRAKRVRNSNVPVERGADGKVMAAEVR
jgi:hypothetical protein